MESIVTLLVCLCFVVVVSSSSCDYNVNSIADYQGLDQGSFGPSTTICWAAGIYTASLITVSTNQIWLGPQHDVDASCGRVVNPPCSRLVSASSQNSAVEAIFVSTSVKITATGSFTFNGFSVVNGGFYDYFFFYSSPPLYVSNNYWYFSEDNSGVNGEIFLFSNNYVNSTVSSTNGFTGSTNLVGNFFTGIPTLILNNAVSNIVIANNTILFGCIYSLLPFTTNGNLIVGCSSNSIADNANNSTHTNNVFLYNAIGLNLGGTYPITGNISNNCFTDEATSLSIFSASLSTGTEVNANYWGDKTGPSFYISSHYNSRSGRGSILSSLQGSFLSTFTFEKRPVKLSSPNVCPGHMIDIRVEPHTVKTGFNTTIHWSFTLNPQLYALGLSPNLYSNTNLTFQIGAIPNDVQYTRGSALSCNPIISFTHGDLSVNGSCVVLVDIENLPSGLNPTDNYTLIATASPTTALPYFTSIAHTPISVIPVLPEVCWKNFTQTLNIPKVSQLNGPVHLTLANFSCNAPGFFIKSVPANSLNAVLQSGKIVFTISQEGVYVLPLTISPSNNGNINAVYTFHATLNIEIDNHAPIAGSPTLTYPKTRTTPLPSWNVLDYCSDQDGDTLTTLQIQPSKGWSDLDIQQLSPLQLYFINEKVVVTVSAQGNITLSTPVINGNNVTPGSDVATSWHQNIGFQFQITDGDRKNSNAWGIFRISHS